MNPPNCSEAKYLRCHGELPCGWGCQVSGYVNCFSLALGLGRILDFYKTPDMFYEPNEFQIYYEPITNCNSTQLLDKVDNWPGNNFSSTINLTKAYEIPSRIRVFKNYTRSTGCATI